MMVLLGIRADRAVAMAVRGIGEAFADSDSVRVYICRFQDIGRTVGRLVPTGPPLCGSPSELLASTVLRRANQ